MPRVRARIEPFGFETDPLCGPPMAQQSTETMGLFGTLIGWDQQKEATNVVLASQLIETASPELRRKIANRIAELILEKIRGTPEEVLENLSHRSRVVQMQFVALACNNLGISPNVPHVDCFHMVINPYLAEGRCEDRIASAVSTAEKYGVHVKWPCDSVKVDFIKLYRQG
jgi:hypothetical protein